MGSNLATELADGLLELDLETQIAIHLTSNHYPPVPRSMVQPCIDAIDAYYEEDYNKMIEMPEGVFYRGSKFAPASAIIEQHHLDAWLPECDVTGAMKGMLKYFRDTRIKYKQLAEQYYETDRKKSE